MTNFTPQEIIARKRDGAALGETDIQAFIGGITTGEVSDAQIAALAMVTIFRGMELSEMTALTLAMRDSGSVLQWNDLPGPVLDKHSTGGVGDLVSLILGPLVASCGGFVPMISGRGLGHTGGTLDKLDSIPGFDTGPDIGRFQSLVRSNGVAIIGQTSDLAPADKRFYAVRDVTATVESVPLIVASILSKKLAEGLDGLVMDVKVGSGAFMRDLTEARTLATSLTRVSNDAGLACNSLITDMNQPLAWSAGNALEVMETVAYLAGENRHPRLDRTIRALAAEMVLLGGLAENLEAAGEKVAGSLDSGSAAETFARMVTSQGGPADLMDRPSYYLAEASVRRPVAAGTSGYIAQVDTRSIGMTVVELGGGRRQEHDLIDPSVGLSHLGTCGQKIDADTPLAWVHASDEAGWERAAARVRSAYALSEELPGPEPIIIERIGGGADHATG